MYFGYNFWMPWATNFIFGIQVCLKNILVMLAYIVNRVKVNVNFKVKVNLKFHAITFECLELHTSFLVYKYILRISKSSLHNKVKKMWRSILSLCYNFWTSWDSLRTSFLVNSFIIKIAYKGYSIKVEVSCKVKVNSKFWAITFECLE